MNAKENKSSWSWTWTTTSFYFFSPFHATKHGPTLLFYTEDLSFKEFLMAQNALLLVG